MHRFALLGNTLGPPLQRVFGSLSSLAFGSLGRKFLSEMKDARSRSSAFAFEAADLRPPPHKYKLTWVSDGIPGECVSANVSC